MNVLITSMKRKKKKNEKIKNIKNNNEDENLTDTHNENIYL